MGVFINGHDSFLLQRSSLHLLELATKNHIVIHLVKLHNCLRPMRPAEKCALNIAPGLALTSDIACDWLQISQTNEEMTEEQANQILDFSSNCPSLRQLSIVGCVIPISFNNESTLSNLLSKKVTVKWQLFSKSEWYILNLEEGHWESQENEIKLTVSAIEEMRSRMDVEPDRHESQ